MLPYTKTFPVPGIIPIKDSKYFLSDQPNSTFTSNIIRDIKTPPTVNSTQTTSHIPSSVPIFETSNILNSPPGLLSYDAPHRTSKNQVIIIN